MASIYKPAREQGKKRGTWYIDYTDHRGQRRTLKGFTDKTQTERMAAMLEHEVILRKRGLIDPEHEQLLKRKKNRSPCISAISSEVLATKTAKHVKLIMARVRRVIVGGKFLTASQIEVELVENFLREMCEKHKRSHRTYNHYFQAMDEFCNWMLTTRRVPSNPLIGMERLNAAMPTVTVAAAGSKHRRCDVLPLHPNWRACCPPG